MSFTRGLRMKPDKKSWNLLGVTRSKAKMIEYGVPEEYRKISLPLHPAKLFPISIGLLGDVSAAITRNEPDSGSFSELKTSLLFSARFFDAYLESGLDKALDPYVMLLGSACYYLCDLPGSSAVLAKRMKSECPDLAGACLENLLLCLLQADPKTSFKESAGPFVPFIVGISKGILQFLENGQGEENLLDFAVKLRNAVYEYGTPRQLLLGDVIAAVLRKKIKNSVWKALPLYSGLSRDKWHDALRKASFIRELWPAQHLLGQKGVLMGRSAIVQMPTSAGKTKATELILRSAFLAGRTLLAIIVAPYRALCHEIRDNLFEAFRDESVRIDELSDTLQTDFEIAKFIGRPQVLITTPEKLTYVLRHAPEMAPHIGLLIFDEGHQFDNGIRGITYELLLTSLRSMIAETAQKVLISAVISNAEEVGEWLNDKRNVVEGNALNPTHRLIGFASWLDQMGKIEYVDSRNAEQSDFFVPRVIERLRLEKKGQERKDRFFPEKKNTGAIALYLGLKLVPNGSVAVFCGTKLAAASICKTAIDIIERGAPVALPSSFSDAREIERLEYLHIKNLGTDAPMSRCAAYGIFFHHGNMPHGIRLAVEYAIRNGLARFVVCTSTLAQGVNLPIRYLVMAELFQGKECIRVRDFHNLIGRAGRAGMHTEGSVLFADFKIFDKRRNRNDKWRWIQVKKLLEPGNTEPCISALLSVFDPITFDDGRSSMTGLDFVRAYINNPNEISQQAAGEQIVLRIGLICAVESFLLSQWNKSGDGLSESEAIRLAEGTLAFFLADDRTKDDIRELFRLLARNISDRISDPVRCQRYGRTLYGVNDASTIEQWVSDHAESLLSCSDETDMFDILWQLIRRHINKGICAKFDKPEVVKEIANGWIGGRPYDKLLNIIRNRGARRKRGERWGEFKIDHVVDICEGTLAFEGALAMSAVCEFIRHLDLKGAESLANRLNLFQKQLKYGLPSELAVSLYELGFPDRVIAQDLAESLNFASTSKKALVRALKIERDEARAVMEKYPDYYQKRLEELLR